MVTLPPFRFTRVHAMLCAALLVIAVGIVAWRMQDGRLGGLSDFALRQRVSAQGVLHFSFPQEMDRASVEELIDPVQDIEGDWQWDGDVLTLRPAAPLKAGASYSFLLPSGAKTRSGTPLGRDLEFVFTVAGPPVVAARIPGPDATMIRADSRISMVFDRPMIPLSQVQGEFAKDAIHAWPVTIAPPVEGRWRWLSTVAREFIPSAPLKEGTRYTVTVPAGIASVAGDKTETAFTWSFETLRPEVESTEPEYGTRAAGPTSVIELRFNREMDPTSAAPLMTLSDATGLPPIPQGLPAPRTLGKNIGIASVKHATHKDDDGTVTTDKHTLVITPAQKLGFNATYVLQSAPGIRGLEGDLGTASGHVLSFSTVGDLKAYDGVFDPYGQLSMKFSNPMDETSLAKGITIAPAPLNAKDLTWSTYGMNDYSTVQSYPSLKPSTTYTVTVNGAQDAYGQKLAKPYTFTFTTPQLTPEIGIHSEGEFGIFERGKPPIYYLNALNVSTLNLRFAKLTPEQFMEIRKQRRNGWSYAPELADKDMFAQWSLKPAAKLNDWDTIPFDPQTKLGQELGPGIYALQLRAPEYSIPGNPGVEGVEQQYFAVTNLAITLKYSGEKSLVWVTDMRTGDPVKGARITLRTLDGRSPRSGTTDALGFYETDLPIEELRSDQYMSIPQFWVTAETPTDIAFVGSDWSNGMEPYNFGFPSDFRYPDQGKQSLDAYLYTERPIYKAGDTVHFKGIMRLRDRQGRYSVPTDRSMKVTVQDAEWNEIYSKKLPINAFGSFSDDIVIGEQASLGAYYVSAQVTPETDIAGNNASANFSVLAYRKPEYQVTVTPEEEEYFSGDTVQAVINGSYYFGAPMGNAAVQWRAVTTDYFFNKYTDGWYSFSLEDSWCWYDCSRETDVITEGKGTLDAAGNMTVKVPVDLQDKALSQVLSIEADITDLNNQVVSSRGSVYVHKANAYVGLRTQEYVVEPGQSVTVDAVTVMPDGKPLPNKKVSLQLYSRTWNSIRKKSVDGEYYYDNEPQDVFIRSVSLTTNGEGKGSAAVAIPSGGEFRIVGSVDDGSGRTAKAATSVYAWSSTYVNWARSNNDRIDVIADKPEYAVGDTAVLLVKSPYQGKGVKALVTVERENILSKKVIDIVSNAQPVEIPITEDLLPNAYVSVVVVKPRIGETFDENGLDTGAPAFKIGYTRLSVDVSGKALHVDVTTDKPTYGPGETVNVTIKTKDAQGKPTVAEVSLGAVDMSLLALSSFETPDLTRLFYAQRGLGVFTAEMLTYILERYKPGSKGGGGGSDPESRKRGTFVDTAYWNASVLTDAQGNARLSFTLPDNLTTWQLLAVGSSKDHRFGSKAMTIIETKKVILRPVRPRFAVTGDRIDLGAIVHNFLPTPQTFTVTVTGSGFTAAPKPQTVTVSSGGQQKLLFPVVAAAAPSMTLTMKAVTQGAVDEIEETIPIHAFATPQSVATTGITEKVALEKVIAPTKKDASDGSLLVSVSPSLAAYLPKALDYLTEYPYGCAEQTMSSFLPGVALSRLEEQGATAITKRKRLETNVSVGLQRLYTLQRSDGGFGYFEGSLQSSPSLSAYLLHGFIITQKSGFAVDQSVINRTMAYLSDVLRTTAGSNAADLALRADILFALSEAGQSNIALLNNLAEQRAKLPLFSQARLAMALDNAGSPKADQVIDEIVNRALLDSRGTHFEEEDSSSWSIFMNTTQRTTAIVLNAMVRVNPDHPLIPNVTRYLLTSRKDGHWDTTQSTAFALLAFDEYLRATGELQASFEAGINVNGERVLNWRVGKDAVLQRQEVRLALDELKRGEENPVQIGLSGNGRLYYDLLLSYLFTGDRIEPAEEGIGVQRSVRPVGKKESLTSETLKVGETYAITLTLSVPQERHYVAVESPIPAGMEIIDLSLETSQQQLLSGADDAGTSWSRDYWERGLWAFGHREVRDDRYFLFAETLPAGVYQYTYLARATTPGTFRRRPTRAFEMYFPEVFGQTDGTLVTIGE